MGRYIQQPKDYRIKIKNAELAIKWKTDFSDKWNSRYQRAQNYLDRTVLMRSNQFIKRRTGRLVYSSLRETRIGSGLVRWRTPYARAVYYGRYFGKNAKTGKPMRSKGKFWFRRMKAISGRQAVSNTRKIAGGGQIG